MPALAELRALLRLRLLQLTALTGLLTAVGFKALNLKFGVHDLDVWWHLKVGQWIVEHHGFPHTGILSRTAANRPWTAYSWGYELLLSRFYAWFGLVGIAWFGALLTLAVACAIYWMVRRLSGRFWPAWLLAAVTVAAFLFDIMPRPVFFSMALFSVTLTLLLEAQRTARVQLLYWLPLVFVFWANLHIQFVYGMFAVGLFVGVNLLQRAASHFGIAPDYLPAPTLPARAVAAVFLLCGLATCIGPCSFHLYQVVYSYSKAKAPYNIIMELQPLGFRWYSNYLQLFLAAAAFFAVGARKKIDFFKLGLLAVASAVSFHVMRDSWFICIAAAACIADSAADESGRDRPQTFLENFGVATVVAVLLLLFARNLDVTQRGLDRDISRQFPVDAVNFLRRNPPPGPLYNNLDWGGFLTWYMPDYPVAIDGRTDLYGDKMDELFFNTGNGVPSYVNDPYLNAAGVVLLPRKLSLTKFLTADPRFQLIYQDQLAAVFVRR
jgi:hypothetical protein